jgi:hypothetical protein
MCWRRPITCSLSACRWADRHLRSGRPRTSARHRAQDRSQGVRNALTEASSAALQNNGRWLVTGGTDLDGDPVTLVVTFYRGLVIVTLY